MNTATPPLPRATLSSSERERWAIRSALRIESHLFPLVVIAYTCLLPRELIFQIGPIEFDPTRTGAVLMTPFALAILKRRPVKFSPLDILATFVFTWYLIAAYTVDGFPNGAIRGLGYASSTALVYLIARVGIRTHEDFRRLLILLLPGLFLAGLLIFIESITHTIFVRPLIGELVGRPPPSTVDTVRLGLMRGSGPFTHPILGGVFLAALLPVYWAAFGNLPRLRIVGMGVAIFGFFSLSSAAILALAIGVSAILALKLQRLTRIPLFLLGGLATAAIVLALEVVTKYGALHFLLRNLTLNAGTARYRTSIWEHATLEVMNHPLFGIGGRDWIRPLWMIRESVDAYWLFIAMRYGLPASVGMFLLALCVVVLCVRSAAFLPKSPARDMHVGVAISVSVLVFSAFTVHLWEGILSLFLILIASGIALSQVGSELGRIRRRAPVNRPSSALRAQPRIADASRQGPSPQ
ncbi:MAG: O-antigen ligase family protein [Pseudomonadota bacterium]